MLVLYSIFHFASISLFVILLWTAAASELNGAIFYMSDSDCTQHLSTDSTEVRVYLILFV